MKNLSLLLVCSALLVLTQCRKESAPKTLVKKPSQKVYEIRKGASLNADFCGMIRNESGQPVAGATVKVGNKNAVTNQDGFFILNGGLVYENHAYLKVEAAGYFHGSRSLVPQEGMNMVRITLLSKASAGSFPATLGGEIAVGNSRVEFGAGFVNASGTAYTGNVSVAMKYLDPESDNLSETMPGDLFAVSDEGEKVLESFGMIAVELMDAAGNLLQLAEDNEAILHMPLSQTALAKAPAEIPLWYFDEERGYWQEEGSAQLIDGEYIGKVSHFSFWNCDVPRDYSRIDGLVKSSDGDPLAGINVTIRSKLMGNGKCYTSSDGAYGGRVPVGETYTLELSFMSKQVLKSVSIGPFQADAVIPDIILDKTSDLISVEGTVTGCNKLPLKEGYFILETNPIAIKDGQYRFILPKDWPFTARAYDPNSASYSPKKTYGGYSNDQILPNIELCSGGNGQLQFTLTYRLDGVLKTHGLPFGYVMSTNDIQLYCSKGSGDHARTFELQVSNYTSPGTYLITQINGDSLWLGDKKDPLCTKADSVYLTVNEYFIGPNPSHLFDLQFYGTVWVWNELLGIFEKKPLTEGKLHSQR